jgi:SAM-dependent methyltransferase
MREPHTDEWENLEEARTRYHSAQWETPKRSTIAFERFCARWLERSARVVDVACGSGGSTAFLAARHPSVDFVGIDLSRDWVSMGNRTIESKRIANLRLQTGDCFNLDVMRNIDGVISLQTLSWLPQYEAPLTQIFEKLAPKWIGVSSLFYAGDISCRIEVEEHRRKRRYFYNTYSLPTLGRFLAGHGYALASSEPFDIDIDIPKPDDPDIMGTYTRMVCDAGGGNPTRLQMSGPLVMNWYQVLIERK